MAVYTHVSTAALSDFLARYDVGELLSFGGIAEGVENSNYRVDTTKGPFILTLYERRVAASDLPFFFALLDHLAAKGMAVPPAIKDRAGVEIHQLAGRPACLIRFLPGAAVSHPTAAQAHSAGKALGRLHIAATDFRLERANDLGPAAWPVLAQRCGDALGRIADDLRVELDHVLDRWPDHLPRCAIHADLFPDNVLMTGDKVTGLIDFYFACTDIRAYDLAVMHTAWGFDSAGQPGDPAVGRALIDGYAAACALTDAEREALPILARGACIRFVLTRAWDWLNTPPDALVSRKDPLAYWRRSAWYRANPDAFA